MSDFEIRGGKIGAHYQVKYCPCFLVASSDSFNMSTPSQEIAFDDLLRAS